jgi:hypothetical protein
LQPLNVIGHAGQHGRAAVFTLDARSRRALRQNVTLQFIHAIGG